MTEKRDAGVRLMTDALRRRTAPCLVILNQSLEIVSAETSYDDLLEACGMQRGERQRLPREIEAAVKRLMDSADADPRATQHVAVASVPLLVRSCTLYGPDDSCIAVSIERLRFRDPLNGAKARFRLSPRESEVLVLVLHGMEAREIAARMNIAQSTVIEYMKHLYLKTGARNRSAMIARVFDWPEDLS